MDKTERESRILRERRLELGLSQTEVALNAGLQLQHSKDMNTETESYQTPA